MNDEDRSKIISNDYADAITEIATAEEIMKIFNSRIINYMNDKYAVVYFPISNIPKSNPGTVGYSTIPKAYGLTDTSSITELGVTRIQNIPSLNLRGEGVLLGFVDTGISYTNPLFKNDDNSTRIVSIWDQTIENLQAPANIFYYGTEYNRDQINLALQNENPLSIVPSTDEIGHGTKLAALAGGTPDSNNDFMSVAPLSEFVIVKLKQAKASLRPWFGIPDNVPCFQESDIMFGVQYLYNMARKLNRPIAICIGVGTSSGAHIGVGGLADVISDLTNRSGVVVLVAAGNEGNTGHHYYGTIDPKIGYDTVELLVGEKDKSFLMELWGNIPGTYSIDITSPSGEYISRIPTRIGEHREIQFIFENAFVIIDIIPVESETGKELILIRFIRATSGIWKFNVYGKGTTSGFNIWLPMRNFISEETKFLRSSPYITILNPGNTQDTITITAYKVSDKTIYPDASRGFSSNNRVNPDLAAPGMDVYTPVAEDTFELQSGTSLATSYATGVSALLLEWGIVRKNDIGMDGLVVKQYLIRGVKRFTTDIYPNREWGYGAIDIYGTFMSLAGE